MSSDDASVDTISTGDMNLHAFAVFGTSMEQYVIPHVNLEVDLWLFSGIILLLFVNTGRSISNISDK